MRRRTWWQPVVLGLVAASFGTGSAARAVAPTVAQIVVDRPEPAGFSTPMDVTAAVPSRAGLTTPLQVGNWWRSMAGRYPDGAALAPLVDDAALAASSQRHVDYLGYLRTVGSSYCGHGTDPAFPPLDPASRQHNVLFCNTAPIDAVDGWLATPLHGEPFLSPRSVSMGFGYSTAGGSAAGFGVLPVAQQPRTIHVFPKPGGVMPLLEWFGGESPDPSVACPPLAGVENGESAQIFLPPFTPAGGTGLSTTYRALGLRVVDGAGASVPACLMTWDRRLDQGDPVFSGGDAYVFPQVPWREGETYRIEASFQPEPGGAPVTVAWGFTAHDATTPQPTVRRLLDTREGVAALAAGQVVELAVGGVGGVPVDASAVVLNVTVTEPGAPGFVTVWPCGQPRPLASNVNYAARQTVANAVFTRPGDGGRVCFFSPVRAHLVVDLQGWFVTEFAGGAPVRILETRAAGQTGYTGAKPTGGQVIELPVGGRFGVPTDASAVVLNVTATEADAGGFVTVWPCGQPRPLASNLNVAAGQTVANAVVARPGVDGKVCVYTLGATHLVADLQGWFPSAYRSTAPVRVLETRAAGQTGYVGAKPAAGQVVALRVAGVGGVPDDLSAVVLNVTATEAEGAGFVTVWPCGQARPLASNLNYTAGQSVPNVVVARPNAAGQVCLFALTRSHLVVDLQGWFP